MCDSVNFVRMHGLCDQFCLGAIRRGAHFRLQLPVSCLFDGVIYCMWKRATVWQILPPHVVCRPWTKRLQALLLRSCNRLLLQPSKASSMERIGSDGADLTPPTHPPLPRALHASGTSALRRNLQWFSASIYLLTQRFLARARDSACAGRSKATYHVRSYKQNSTAPVSETMGQPDCASEYH